MLKFSPKPANAVAPGTTTPVKPQPQPKLQAAPTPASSHTDSIQVLGQTYSKDQLEELLLHVTTLVLGEREQITRVLIKTGWKPVKLRGAYLFEFPGADRVKDFPMARHHQLRRQLEVFRGVMNSRVSKEPQQT